MTSELIFGALFAVAILLGVMYSLLIYDSQAPTKSKWKCEQPTPGIVCCYSTRSSASGSCFPFDGFEEPR